MYNYTFMLPVERTFDFRPSTVWMLQHWTWSIWLSLAYVVLIFGGQRLMLAHEPWRLRWPLALWNASLALFSIAGTVRLTPDFFECLANRGFVHSICVMDFKHNVVGFWTQLFGFSKAVELIDTAFIVLRKRPLIFLHWYHHITVFVFTWHAYKDHTAAGSRWFVYMNYAVHAVMYTYYTLRSLGIRLPRQAAMCVTSLQIGQMLVGLLVVLIVYWLKRAQPLLACQHSDQNLHFALAIYASYLLLFANFFHRAYLASHGKHASRKEEGRKLVEQNGTLLQNGALKSNGFAAHNGKQD